MNSRNTFLKVAMLAATIGGSAMAGPAQEESPPAQVVSYSDLNLKAPAGVAALYRRIQTAADVVCEYPPAARHQHALIQERKACRARATERAVVQIDVPALNALHLASTGRNAGPAQVASNERPAQ
jgi:UrcA family protein